MKIAGADPDFHRRDLFEAIERGDFPEWELGLQLFDQKFADKFAVRCARSDQDHSGGGAAAANRRAAGAGSHGPTISSPRPSRSRIARPTCRRGSISRNDPLLQGRLFSYLDTQLKRLGGPNFHQIPVNQPKQCPFANFQRDGHMQTNRFAGRANYEPNSLARAGEPGGPRESPERGFSSFAEPLEGEKQRIRPESFADHYSQARLFFQSLHEAEQNHAVSALVFELSKVTLAHVRERMLGNLRNVDEDLAKRVADGIGMDLPAANPCRVKPQNLKPSPALRIIGNMKHTLKGRSVGILIDDGSDAKILASVKESLTGAGARAIVIAPKVGGAVMSSGKKQAADAQLAGCPSVMVDAIALILNTEAATKLCGESAAVQFVMDAFGHLKAIGHTPGAMPLMEKAGVKADEGVVKLEGKAFITAAAKRFYDREPKVRMVP